MHDLAAGVAAHDGIVHEQHVLAAELHRDGIQLLPHRALADRLAWHDERAADVAVLDEALAVRQPDAFRKLHRGRPARVRNRDHDVDVEVPVVALDLLGEADTHAQPRLVDRDAVDHRIGPRQVDELENTRVEGGRGGALLAVEVAVLIDEDRLSGGDVAHQLEAQGVERHGLRGHHVLVAVLRLGPPEHQGPDAVGVAEGEQPVARDHRDHGVGAAAPAVDTRDPREDGRGVELVVCRAFLQLMREDVEQHLRVGIGIDVPQVLAEQIVLQLLRVGEVAVMAEHDAEGGVHVERLRFRTRPGGAGGRITRVRDAGGAAQRPHVACPEHVAHHARALVHVKRGPFGRDDAGRVLAAVLQHQQPVIEQLIDLALCDDSNDSAHRVSSRAPRVPSI